MRLNFRLLSLGGVLVCAGGMAFALYLQYFRDYEPCPMCIFQRIAMMGAGVFFLLGVLHGPAAWGRWAYSLLAALSAGGGAAVAARHVWLQSLPPDQVPACGPTLDYLLGMLPVMEVITMVLKGDGNCAKIDAQWLGLSLPMWTLIAFIGIAVFALAMPAAARYFERNRT
ncbi:MAG: disulfide bond formation protein B [Nevskiales bacterium]|nr:disulfide bond formation protein B [Nevskiales bacterium]